MKTAVRAVIVAMVLVSVLGMVWVFKGPAVNNAVVGKANVAAMIGTGLTLLVTVVLLWPQVTRRRAAAAPVVAAQAQAAIEYLAGETLRSWRVQAKDRRITTPSPALVRWGWALIAGLVIGVVIGVGLGFGLLVAFTVGSGPALQLAIVETVWRLRFQRVRFMPLLQTALDRQVLRRAGAVYQFRHAALQDLLATREMAAPKQLASPASETTRTGHESSGGPSPHATWASRDVS